MSDRKNEMCSCFDGPDAVEVRQVNYSTNECLICKKPFIETEVFARTAQDERQRFFSLREIKNGDELRVEVRELREENKNLRDESEIKDGLISKLKRQNERLQNRLIELAEIK